MSTPTIADIFRQFGPVYRDLYKERMPVNHLRVMLAIQSCRTSALGGHLYECDHCGAQHYVFHSCRNRHCPTCQFLPTERWLDSRKADLLPIPYFHVVFTIPGELHNLFRSNQRRCYSLLFRAASQTLLTLATDPKHLGAKIGILAVLHTWTQTMAYHPHIHCIVTGGGLKGNQWVAARNDFFLPVRVMSRPFRGKLLRLLQHDDDLPPMLSDQRSTLYQKEWVVYCKPSFHKPQHVLAYLGRYTHRIAIANSRILTTDTDGITFRYRDPVNPKTSRVMRLHPLEFIRRFLTHVLPSRLVKIRYFGLLANRSRKQLLKQCRRLLCVAPPQTPDEITWHQLLIAKAGIDPTRCPIYSQGTLIFKACLPSAERAPPHILA